MNTARWSDALDTLDARYLCEAMAYRKPPHCRSRRRTALLLTAAVLAVLLAGCGILGITCGDSLQSWFSHTWESLTGAPIPDACRLVIGGLEAPIGVSAVSDGMTVTVDSAVCGDECFYLLLRAEGTEIRRGKPLCFSEYDLDVTPRPADAQIYSCGIEYLAQNETGAGLFLLTCSLPGTSGETSPLSCRLKLDALSVHGRRNQDKPISDGTWELSFALDRSAPLVSRSLPDTVVSVPDAADDTLTSYALTDIRVTDTGIRFVCTSESHSIPSSAEIAVQTKDGFEIPVSEGTGIPLHGADALLSCSYHWKIPVSAESITAVRIGETLLPLS